MSDNDSPAAAAGLFHQLSRAEGRDYEEDAQYEQKYVNPLHSSYHSEHSEQQEPDNFSNRPAPVEVTIAVGRTAVDGEKDGSSKKDPGSPGSGVDSPTERNRALSQPYTPGSYTAPDHGRARKRAEGLRVNYDEHALRALTRVPTQSTTAERDELEKEEDEDEERQAQGEQRRLFPLVTSTAEQLAVLGTGVGTYFKSLEQLGAVCAVMAALVMYNLAAFMFAGTSDLWEEYGGKVMLFTVGMVPVADQLAAAGAAEEGEQPECCRTGTSTRRTLFTAAVLDTVGVLLFFGLVLGLRIRRRAVEKAMDHSIITCNDYAVFVRKGLPQDATEAEVKAFFEEVAGPVADVVIVTDVSEVLMAIREHTEVRQEVKAHRALLDKTAGKQGGGREGKASTRMAALQASIHKMKEGGRATVCRSAFVTFEHEKDKVDAMRMYHPNLVSWCMQEERMRFRQQHRIVVEQAPEPSDILWENIQFDWRRVYPRRAMTAAATFVLLLATIGVVITAKDQLKVERLNVQCANTEYSRAQLAELDPGTYGTLACGAIWSLHRTTNSTEETARLEAARSAVDGFRRQASVDTCSSYVDDNALWTADAGALYAAVTPPQGATWTDYWLEVYEDPLLANQTGDGAWEWEGGLVVGTGEAAQMDECAGLVCYQCFCADQGLAAFQANKDGIRELCNDYWQEYLAAQAASAGIVAVITVVDYLLMSAMSYFAQAELHMTLSALETSVARKVFYVLCLNNAVLPLLIYAKVDDLKDFPILFKGEYTDFTPDWYDNVGSSLYQSMLTNVFSWPLRTPLMGLAGYLTRWWFQKSATTQTQLNRLYEPPQFSLAERNGQLLSFVTIALAFSAGMPLMLLLLTFFVVFQYISDKYMLLRQCMKPPRYGMRMAQMVLSTLPFAAAAHFALGIWMFGYEGLDSGEHSLVDADDRGQFNILHRLRKDITLPFTLGLVVVVGSNFLFNNVDRIVHAFRSGSELEGVPPFSTTEKAGLPSYRIEDNPKYKAWLGRSSLM